MKFRSALPVTLAIATLALAGCSSTSAQEESDGLVHIVATTNVYADVAQVVGGDRVSVESIITSDAQDPHSYEVTAQDRLKVEHADLLVRNGGGYDTFVDALVDDKTPVVTAVDLAPDLPEAEAHDDHDHAEGEHEHSETESATDDHAGHDHIEGFNEHVWYDPEIVSGVALHIAEELSAIDPASAADFAERSAAFQAEMAGLSDDLATLKAAHAGDKIFVTEPVPLRLTDRAGLVNVTPEAFTEAVEEGQDVPPATLLSALDILKSGDVKVVILNTQTGGSEAARVEKEAEVKKISTIAFSEVLPEGESYVSWMTDNIDALRTAVSA